MRFTLLIYFIDKEHLLKKKTEIVNKLIDIFKAESVSENVMKFKIGTYDCYAEIDRELKYFMQHIGVVIINFHIPKDQFKQLSKIAKI